MQMTKEYKNARDIYVYAYESTATTVVPTHFQTNIPFSLSLSLSPLFMCPYFEYRIYSLYLFFFFPVCLSSPSFPKWLNTNLFHIQRHSSRALSYFIYETHFLHPNAFGDTRKEMKEKDVEGGKKT